MSGLHVDLGDLYAVAKDAGKASAEYQKALDYMLSDELTVDGAKKNPMNVRPWDHQMRQSILIASNNAVLWEAPVAGFLHATNNLDTLGVDQPNTMCKFARK